MFEHPLIDKLDLRNKLIIIDHLNTMRQREDDGWAWQGDFPAFPERLAVFINTGKFPKKWVTVKIRINTAQFMESIRLASDFAKNMAGIQKATQR